MSAPRKSTLAYQVMAAIMLIVAVSATLLIASALIAGSVWVWITLLG